MAKKKFQSLLSLWLFRLTGALPFSAARRLGSLLGRAAYRLNTREAKITRANLRLCFPELSESQREQRVRASLCETGQSALEIPVLWQSRPEQVRSRILSVDGEAFLDNALAEQKGVILLAPHLGNWEVLTYYFSQKAHMVSLYQPPKDDQFEPIVKKSREQSGSELVPTTAKGVASLIKNLKHKQICGILPDQNPHDDRSGGYAPFFGHPAFSMTLIYKMLQKTGARAIFAFAERVPGGFVIRIQPAAEGLYSEDLLTSLTAMNRGIERLIHLAPHQYQWEYKRFKKREAGTEFKPYHNMV